MEMPPALLHVIYPFFSNLEKQCQALEAAGKTVPSVRSVVECLRYLATVFFQDALELVRSGECLSAEGVCLDPCIMLIWRDQAFQRKLAYYTCLYEAGVSLA